MCKGVIKTKRIIFIAVYFQYLLQKGKPKYLLQKDYAHAGTRTRDPGLIRPMLYRLSYTSIASTFYSRINIAYYVYIIFIVIN